jgi:uncharacterized protein involved in exopolysaccharide biosynthesis
MENKQKEIDLSKVVLVLKDNKKPIGIVTGITTLIAIAYCVFATPIYTAKTIINPPKLTDAGSGVSQALNGLAALTGGSGGLLSQKTDADVAIALLNTAALKNLIIDRFGLMKYLDKKDIELTRAALDQKIKFIPDMKSGFLEIDVDDKDPKLAANIANYYTIALGQLISNIAYNRSKQKMTFFEGQLKATKQNLTQSESAIKTFIQKNGIIAGQQVQVLASIATQLQSKLVVAQAQLQSLAYYASPDNPEYKSLQVQIDSYKQQLNQINDRDSADNIAIPSNLAPDLAQQYLNLMRNFVLQEEVYKLLTKQYQANRLDALSEMIPTAVQVVDPAVEPLHKSKPKRLKVVLGAMVLSGLLTSICFIIRNRKRIIIEV